MNDKAHNPADAVTRRVEYLLGAELSGRWDSDQQLGWAGMMEISRLRHWTIVLENPEEVDEVRTRVRAAGTDIAEYEEVGFLVRDPWNIVTAIVCDRRR